MTSLRRLITPAAVFAASTAAIVGFAGAATATAAFSVVEGNPNCSGLDPTWTEAKIDANPAPGEYTFGDLTVTVTKAGEQLGWASSSDLSAVIVKGGPVANVYDYPGTDDLADDGLVAPTNGSNSQPYGISHVSFCYGPAAAPTDPEQPAPAPAPEETPAPAPVPAQAPVPEPEPQIAAAAAASVEQPVAARVLGVQIERTEAAVAAETLAVTGIDTTSLAVAGIALVGVGTALLPITRRRRTSTN